MIVLEQLRVRATMTVFYEKLRVGGTVIVFDSSVALNFKFGFDLLI